MDEQVAKEMNLLTIRELISEFQTPSSKLHQDVAGILIMNYLMTDQSMACLHMIRSEMRSSEREELFVLTKNLDLIWELSKFRQKHQHRAIYTDELFAAWAVLNFS